MNIENNGVKKENRLTDNTLRLMEVVEKELEYQKHEAVFCLTLFLCASSLWILAVALWEMLGKPLSEEAMTVGVEIIAVLMFLSVIKFTRINVRNMGITSENLSRSLIRGGVISVIVIILMVAVKLITQGSITLDWSEFSIRYIFTSILQEFLARGFLVTTLINIIDKKNSPVIAVICSSLLFTSLHLYYGFTFMVGAGILSVILGFCYLKDRNIWGVSLIHFVFGTVGCMLGLV